MIPAEHDGTTSVMFLFHWLRPYLQMQDFQPGPRGSEDKDVLSPGNRICSILSILSCDGVATTHAATKSPMSHPCKSTKASATDVPHSAPVLPKLPPWVLQPYKGPGTTAARAPPICQGHAVVWACHTSKPHTIVWTLQQCP